MVMLMKTILTFGRNFNIKIYSVRYIHVVQIIHYDFDTLSEAESCFNRIEANGFGPQLFVIEHLAGSDDPAKIKLHF